VAAVSEQLALVGNAVERDLYLKRLAERLGVGEAAVRAELRPGRPAPQARPAVPPREAPTERLGAQEAFLVQLLLLHPELGPSDAAHRASELVANPAVRALLQVAARGRVSSATLLETIEDEPLRAELRRRAFQDVEAGGDHPAAALEQCVARLHEQRVAQRQRALVHALGDDPTPEALREIQELARRRQQVASAGGDVE